MGICGNALQSLTAPLCQVFDGLASSDELRMDYVLQPGDMKFLHNHLIVHTQAEYREFEVGTPLLNPSEPAVQQRPGLDVSVAGAAETQAFKHIGCCANVFWAGNPVWQQRFTTLT